VAAEQGAEPEAHTYGECGERLLAVTGQDGRDIRTIYAHLSSVKEPLEAGHRIETGDRIGRVGSTGTSTGSHLYYEVTVDEPTRLKWVIRFNPTHHHFERAVGQRQ
jgi:murein DD-endopeptidase MepM/ murein hydrolase activator NlpD